MPCFFIDDVPQDFEWDTKILTSLIASVTVLAGSGPEIHLTGTVNKILIVHENAPKSTAVPAKDVHVFVEWHEREQDVCQKVAEAIHAFLFAHGFEKTDITFRNSPVGSFFINGKPAE